MNLFFVAYIKFGYNYCLKAPEKPLCGVTNLGQAWLKADRAVRN